MNDLLKKVHHLDLDDFNNWNRSSSSFQAPLFSLDGTMSPERLSALVARSIQKAGYPPSLITLHSCRSGFLFKSIASNIGNPDAMATAWVRSR